MIKLNVKLIKDLIFCSYGKIINILFTVLETSYLNFINLFFEQKIYLVVLFTFLNNILSLLKLTFVKQLVGQKNHRNNKITFLE